MGWPTIVIYDNGGSTLDRYTIVIQDDIGWEVRTGSAAADSPQGVWQHLADGVGLVPGRYRDGTPVALEALPEGLRKAIADYLADANAG